MKKWEKFNQEELENALTTSFSYKEALQKLGYSPYSTNNKIIREISNKYNIDISHFTSSTVKNLIGQKFGRLTVINRDNTKEKGHQKDVYWNCLCDCGNVKSIRANSLLLGKTLSCGCLQKEKIKEALKLNLLGKRFGKLVVIEQALSVIEKSGTHRTVWKCKCDCGKECFVKTINLRSGDTQSCGCIYSQGEFLIESILKKNNFSFKREYSFDDLLTELGNKMRFDFAVFDDDNKILCLIEFQGIYHYESCENKKNVLPIEIRKERDKKKQEYCKEKNYKLITIPYWDYEKININYLKERIYNECCN